MDRYLASNIKGFFMKRIFRLKAIQRMAGITALVALIGLSFALAFTACGGGGVSGTYVYEYGGGDTNITFTGSNWTGKWSIWNGAGTYSVSGKTLTLKSSSTGGIDYFTGSCGSTWNIVDANTIQSNGAISGDWIKQR